jgi:hypothetical protein
MPHNKAINPSGEGAELIVPAALRRRVIADVMQIPQLTAEALPHDLQTVFQQ